MKTNILIILAIIILAGCQQQPQKSDQELIEQGNVITGKLLTTLLNELNTEIQENGIAEAINYCSVYALPLTQNIAEEEEVELSRVSHRNRNPLNVANKEETELIEKFINQLQEGETLSPIIISKNKQKIYYSPILLGAPLCLNCHGKPEDFDPGLSLVLNQKYPNDKADNFELGEVRGMFKIVFK
jgi:hypothetical protein